MTQFDSTTLATVRQEHATALQHLRAARDAHKLALYRSADALIRETKARLEEKQQTFDIKAIGTNEADRDRAYALYAANDTDYQTALKDLRHWEYEADRLTADIRAYEDDLRERELAIGFTNLRVLRERAS